MIFEFFKHITISAPDYIKKMGYLKEILSIESRYKRFKIDWDRHLKNSKEVIIDALKMARNRRRVVVLGSGLLLDLPLREIASFFDDVVLVDIFHLPQVEEAVKVYENVRLINADITSTAHRLYISRPKPKTELPKEQPFFPECDSHCDLVISLNILSQLPIIPRNYLINELGWKDDEDITNWEHYIINAHFQSLLRLKCPVCLIADWELTYLDKNDVEIERHLTAPVLRDVEPYRQWFWRLVPIGYESKQYSVELTVGAFLFENSELLVYKET
ncbi:MAG: hypothetical protein N3A62_10230 [Thermodesulfovibrionales bacterium]|nr:hypothetical protein [Thermodesulfovibrionales bacterium]